MRFFIVVLTLIIAVFAQPAVMANDSINTTASYIKEMSPAKHYRIKVKVLRLSGLANKQTEAQVNQNIHDTIYKYIDDFKKEAAKNTDSKEVSNLDIDCKTLFIDQTFLSLMLEISAYRPHMAHPDNQLQTINYYLPAAKKLELSDLFVTQDYLKRIAAFATNDLVTRMPQLYGYDPKVVPEHFNYQDAKTWVLRGTEAKAENYQHFSLQQQKLVLYFDYYQVGPRQFGVVEVAIPLTQLESIMSPQYREGKK